MEAEGEKKEKWIKGKTMHMFVVTCVCEVTEEPLKSLQKKEVGDKERKKRGNKCIKTNRNRGEMRERQREREKQRCVRRDWQG